MKRQMQSFWLIGLIGLIAALAPNVQAKPFDPADLNKLYSPRISGDTLVITGRIDSHIHDFISREAAAMEKVKKIELNSVGGNMHWALELARKIQPLGKTTLVPAGNFCASACVYLFSAGKERLAAKGTWLGVHGARLGAIYATQFKEQCFVELETGYSFEPRLKGCQAFLDSWYELTSKATHEGFDFMESNGVSPELRAAYLALPDDETWFEHANVFRKPDWYLSAEDALGLKLVTRLLE